MWIDRKTYDDLRLDNAKLQEESRVLNRTNNQMATTIDWFRVRITQLEHERAQLLFNYTGVKISTPVIEHAPSVDVARALQSMPSFQDIGDAEAAKLGVGWGDAGEMMELKAQRS